MVEKTLGAGSRRHCPGFTACQLRRKRRRPSRHRSHDSEKRAQTRGEWVHITGEEKKNQESENRGTKNSPPPSRGGNTTFLRDMPEIKVSGSGKLQKMKSLKKRSQSRDLELRGQGTKVPKRADQILGEPGACASKKKELSKSQ